MNKFQHDNILDYFAPKLKGNADVGELFYNEIFYQLYKNYKLDNVLSAYEEPHRYYHTLEHIRKMFDMAISNNYLNNDLALAIIFHDIVYDPLRSDNEEKSVEVFRNVCGNDLKHIEQAILDTKTHNPDSKFSRMLSDLDLQVLYGDFETFVNYENKIFKEYQFIDYTKYVEERVKFLTDNNVNKDFIQYIKTRKPKIGVYAGSFDPFHYGHLNILTKAEKIFDKIIIAKGINPSKSNAKHYQLPNALKYRQQDKYFGLLTDYIKTKQYDVTLIRGLRNSTDLQAELTQYRYIQDEMPDINVVSIFCDSKFEHISSSAINMLNDYGKSNKYIVL